MQISCTLVHIPVCQEVEAVEVSEESVNTAHLAIVIVTSSSKFSYAVISPLFLRLGFAI